MPQQPYCRNGERAKMKRLLFLTSLTALILTACGGQATPAVDPAQIQASAVAAASTMVAMTQAAIPAATDVPPTDIPSPTPLPSPTLLALPTLDTGGFPTASIPTAASGTTTDNCQHALDMGAAGPKHRTIVINKSTGTFNISLNLWKVNLFGQCGAISIAGVNKGDRITLDLPSGSWAAFAWISLKGGGSRSPHGDFVIPPALNVTADLCVSEAGILYKFAC